MKNIISIYLVIFGCTLQAQSWQWVRVFGGNKTDYGSKVILQQDGKILMTARFKSGLIQLDTLTVVNGMGSGCIVAKFDQAGNRQTLVTGAVSGNVNSSPYIGAGFMGKSNSNTIYVPIGAEGSWGMLDTITIQPWGHIAEFNSAGRCIRAKRCGDGFRCAKTIGNSVYVQGGYTGNAGTIGTFLLNDPYPTAMTSKATIGKLDNNLNAQWAKQVLGGKQTSLNFLETSDNHLYFLVNSDSCVFYDTMQLCSPPGIPSWAVVKTDTNGNVKWYRSVSCSKFTFDVMSNTVDASGNSYTTCLYDTAVTFCGQTVSKSAGGGYDSYLAKVNSNGILQWISVMKSNGYIGVNASHTDAAGNTYLSGQYSGQCIFGNDTITSTGTEDFYVARYNTSGACMGVLAYYGVSPSGICQDSTGNFILVGSTLGFEYSDSTYVTNGLDDIFIGKHSAISGTTSSKTIEPDGFLNIYANPNAGLFTVEVPQAFKGNEARLIIYGPLGELVKDEPTDISNSRVSVNLGEVVRGIYTVVLQSTQRRFTGRVVVE
jgi:hypothetical protein